MFLFLQRSSLKISNFIIGGTSFGFMATVTESTAFFKARLLAVGVSQGFLARLIGINIDNLAKLAYCCSVVPGSGDDSALVTFFTETNNNVVLDTGELASASRALFEAHTMLISDLRNVLERSSDTTTRSIPVVERASRPAAQ